ncbi:hypothetical protein I3842_03G265200 [Carya illinoinensis]|uniref:Uncharacterized protein n=1 Tax=Carya illinoinensis TaxID=32201 RepID=A0A922K0Z3_CARIL|nr:hypothetical protein I3842_03G265200 [Carya illinoinensis]
MEQVEEQSPHKKIATDGPILADLSNSSPPQMEGKAVLPDSTVDSNVGPSSSSRQMLDEIMLDGRGRRDKGDNQALNASAMLTQIWKNDLDSGRLLDFLFDQFGEGILSFIPAPEMSLFLCWNIQEQIEALELKSCEAKMLKSNKETVI